MNRVPLTVFHLVQHGVETEFVPSFQKFLQPEGGFLLFTETAFLTETFHFPVSVAKSCTDGFCVRCVKIVHQRTPHGFLFGDACLKHCSTRWGSKGSSPSSRFQFSISANALFRADWYISAKVCILSHPGVIRSSAVSLFCLRCGKILHRAG